MPVVNQNYDWSTIFVMGPRDQFIKKNFYFEWGYCVCVGRQTLAAKGAMCLQIKAARNLEQVAQEKLKFKADEGGN
jgi:hypothetical protein